MLICEKGHVFDGAEAGIYRECVTTDPYPYYETWQCCPECGSTDLQDAVHCDSCEDTDGWVCEDDTTKCLNCGTVICQKCANLHNGCCGEDCENERDTNARLGALVKRLPHDASLVRMPQGLWYCRVWVDGGERSIATYTRTTPAEAIELALQLSEQ